MNKAYILLDRSGSMQSQWAEALGSVNGYVSKLENAEVYIAVFDSVSYDVIRNCNVKDYKHISQEEVSPRGGTPLYDSAVRIMWNMLDSRAERAVLVIMTDGEENQSQMAKVADIKRVVKEVEAKKYDMVFLGANFDKIEDVAKSFGRMDMSRAAAVDSKSLGATMAFAAASTQDYFKSGELRNALYSDNMKKEIRKEPSKAS